MWTHQCLFIACFTQASVRWEREWGYSLIKFVGEGLAESRGKVESYKEWYTFDLEIIGWYCHSFVFYLSRWGFEWDVVYSSLCFPLCIALKFIRCNSKTRRGKHEPEKHRTIVDLIKALILVNSIKHFSKAPWHLHNTITTRRHSQVILDSVYV